MNNPGNLFGPIALVVWAGLIFFFFSRYRPSRAAAISIFGGALLLPEQVAFKLPVIPDLDKAGVAILTTLVATLIFARRKLAGVKPFEGVDVIFVLLLIGNIGMWLTNTDTLFIGKKVILPLGAYDALGNVVSDTLMIYGSFYLGRAMFNTLEDVIELLRVMFAFGIIYVGFALIELKFSPQLHTWIYGFMQSDFIHAARAGGFRPMVFLANGLVFARFVAVALIAGIMLWRLNLLGKKGTYGLLFSIAVFMVCKSVGALLMFLIFAPVVALTQTTMQRRLAFLFALIVIGYPAARSADLVPVDDLYDIAEGYSPERAASLRVRFENETTLLDRARERIWFGWGGYGRSLVYNEYGESNSTVDGEWIGTIGYRGILGFVGSYGLYMLPVFLAVRRLKQLRSTEHAFLLGTVALIATFLALDTIPNAASGLPHFFCSGAVAGAASGFLREDQRLRRARSRERREQLAAPADPAAA